VTKLRVVVAEDHYLVRTGVVRALEDSGDIEVLAAVPNAPELEASVSDLKPDVIVTDIRMPPAHQTEGIEAAHRIRATRPEIGVVVLSQYADASYAIELLRDGTAGIAYLLKERIGDPDHLIEAVHSVAAGGSVIDPDVVAALVAQTSGQPSTSLTDLTERELDVLRHMAEGRTNAAIAEQLHLSESSVEKYSTSIFSKLDLGAEPSVHRRVAAVLAYLHRQSQARPI
jgi:DNA-binding NarL/FixJ family response regulator